MAILACFLSNDPQKLELSLYSHASNFSPDSKVLIVDPSKVHDENSRLANEFNAIHVCEEEFKEKFNVSFQPLFQGKFGGNRNICLYHAFKNNSHAVFFDDDTSPSGNPIAQYSSLFEQGKKIICGKYLKHGGGTQSIVLGLINSFEEYATKNSDLKERIDLFFSGVPKENEMPFASAGLVGGNAGISLDALGKYCFFPLDYRVEDAAYGLFSKFFVEEEPFNSKDNTAVFPNKTPSNGSFLKNLES